MIKVTSIVSVVESNGQRVTKPEDVPGLAVKSHWNDAALVVLVVGDRELAVLASDIEAAIANARNSNRHGLR